MLVLLMYIKTEVNSIRWNLDFVSWTHNLVTQKKSTQHWNNATLLNLKAPVISRPWATWQFLKLIQFPKIMFSFFLFKYKIISERRFFVFVNLRPTSATHCQWNKFEQTYKADFRIKQLNCSFVINIMSLSLSYILCISLICSNHVL